MDTANAFHLSGQRTRLVVGLRRGPTRILHHQFLALFRTVEGAQLLPGAEQSSRVYAVTRERRHQGVPAEQRRDHRALHLRISMTDAGKIAWIWCSPSRTTR